jgi:GntR family transcriptional repressor for pyruvate dehydrogenase complex
VKPGERLPTEIELTESLGVSRTCVREAIKSLETLGLISVRQRIGATVLQPSASNLLHAEYLSSAIQQHQSNSLLEFRRILEVGLASLAAEKATEADIEAMETALEKYRAEVKQAHADCSTDLSFHTAMVAAAKNPFAATVWQSISTRLTEVLERATNLPTVPEQTLADHQRILRAIRSRNPKKAREAMRAHLDNAEMTWRVALRDEPEAKPQGRASRTRAKVPVAIPR